MMRNIFVVNDVKIDTKLALEDFTMDYPQGARILDERVGQSYVVGGAEELVDELHHFVESNPQLLESRDYDPASISQGGLQTQKMGLSTGGMDDSAELAARNQKFLIGSVAALAVLAIGLIFRYSKRRKRS